MATNTRQASVACRNTEYRMRVINRQPALRSVAGITLSGGHKVICVFADSSDIVMASIANAAR